MNHWKVGANWGSRQKKRGGFTLVELSIAMSILIIGLVSVTAATSRMHFLRKQNREIILAQNGMRGVAERMHASAHGFSDEPGSFAFNIIARFSAGGSFGGTFDIKGLTPVDGEPTVGTITLITDETQTDAALDARLGMPRDLDGDGAADDTDVSLTARILPVQLTVRWSSRQEINEVEHVFYVLGY